MAKAIDTLKVRKQIKHLLIDLDLDRRGGRDVLLPLLQERIPDINKNKLNLAMTGFCDSYQHVLVELRRVLRVIRRNQSCNQAA